MNNAKSFYCCLSAVSSEPVAAAPAGARIVPVLRAHAPRPALHAVLRERRRGPASPRGHDRRGVRLSLTLPSQWQAPRPPATCQWFSIWWRRPFDNVNVHFNPGEIMSAVIYVQYICIFKHKTSILGGILYCFSIINVICYFLFIVSVNVYFCKYNGIKNY